MKPRTIKYYFYEGFKSILQNGIMTVASVGTVAACVFILIFSFALAVNVEYAMEQLESTVGITAIIDDELTNEEIAALHVYILGMESVSSVQYISSEEAIDRYREETNDTSGILVGVILPRTFAISTDSAAGQSAVISVLEKMIENNEGLTKVNHAQKTISVFTAISNGVRIICIIVILGLCVLSIIIIINTIMLAVNNRKNEINIMKFIGATDWFIRWPFIIEGMIIGLLGAAIPVLIFYFGYNEVIFLVNESITVIKDVFEFYSRNQLLFYIAPAATIMGFLIGIIGSTLSVRKYLNV